jgi:hypothetical protein
MLPVGHLNNFVPRKVKIRLISHPADFYVPRHIGRSHDCKVQSKDT